MLVPQYPRVNIVLRVLFFVLNYVVINIVNIIFLCGSGILASVHSLVVYAVVLLFLFLSLLFICS